MNVGPPNVECVKSGLEVKVEWQFTHVGQTLHGLKDLCFLPLTRKRDRLTAVLQQDRTGVCVYIQTTDDGLPKMLLPLKGTLSQLP